MEYTYFPGCSLEATGRAYDISTRAVAEYLDIKLNELEDWNCCGATTYMGVKEMLAFAISARNLALAEKKGLDLVAPCSACYTTLNKTDVYIKEFPEVKEKVSRALKAGGLEYKGTVKIRHLLEIFVDDLGLENIKKQVKKTLKGFKVAPYYGCQIVRPYSAIDKPEEPTSLDELIEVTGATSVYFPVKTRCCGASLMATKEDVALRLTKNILLAAKQNDADCIVTTCPLCQINLDAYQSKINTVYNQKFNFPIMYFTQLLGLAFELSPQKLGLSLSMVSPESVLAKI